MKLRRNVIEGCVTAQYVLFCFCGHVVGRFYFLGCASKSQGMQTQGKHNSCNVHFLHLYTNSLPCPVGLSNLRFDASSEPMHPLPFVKPNVRVICASVNIDIEAVFKFKSLQMS